MENASKALLIAGGVLIAILILSVLVVTINIINSNQKAKEQALVTEQLVEFNQKWEAYNKKALYGTDIITLMKMAIENNNNMESTQKGQQYFINVKLNLKNEYKSTETTIYKATGKKEEKDKSGKSISGEISLGDWKNGTELTMQDYVENLFGESITRKTETKDKIIYEYSPLANLKKAVFICTKVTYNNNGRISELEFEEK